MLYDPAIFTRVNNLRDAKNIILTPGDGQTTDQRWEKETPHICDLIEQDIQLKPNSVVLDYGCGVGRISKELIRRHNCFAIGADIAPNMRALAESYVASDKFMTCHPQALSLLGVRVDLILTIWVLQHVANLVEELDRIQTLLMLSSGKLFVVNEGTSRFVPTSSGWVNDGLDVKSELSKRFNFINGGHMDQNVVGQETSNRTFWRVCSI